MFSHYIVYLLNAHLLWLLYYYVDPSVSDLAPFSGLYLILPILILSLHQFLATARSHPISFASLLSTYRDGEGLILSVGGMEGASREQSLKGDESEEMTDKTRLQER